MSLRGYRERVGESKVYVVLSVLCAYVVNLGTNFQIAFLARIFTGIGNKPNFMRKSEKGNKVETNKIPTTPKSKNTKTVKALRDRHMKDKDHVITDEDMKNLELENEPVDRSTSHTPKISRKKNRPKDEDKDPKVITPWDVID